MIGDLMIVTGRGATVGPLKRRRVRPSLAGSSSQFALPATISAPTSSGRIAIDCWLLGNIVAGDRRVAPGVAARRQAFAGGACSTP